MPEDNVSYTPEEVAKILKISKFTVYELIKRGELAAYRVGRKVRVEESDLEAYKQKKKNFTNVVIPNGPNINSPVKPVSSSGGRFPSIPIFDYMANAAQPPSSLTTNGLVICGQDILLDILTRHLEKFFPNVRFLRNYIGSIDGLFALYRGQANVVTAHLWDSDNDEYNIPYVRRIMPGHRVIVINLVYRMEGFYVAQGNPKNIRTWKDLARPDVRFINRERGSGARVLLDEQLRLADISHQCINGYEIEETSHMAVASKVARGEGDVGLGIEKAAMQVKGLDFIPLQKERYDLVIRKEDLDKPHFQALLQIILSSAFRQEVEGLGGYDITHMGEIMGEI